MDIAFLGSGNVATQMAIAFREAGCTITQIWSRTRSNAETLAEQVGAVVADSPRTFKPADLYILAVKDDEILSVLEQMPKLDGVFTHTSGATPMDIFRSRTENFGVFYPLQTFSKTKTVDFRNIPLCLEAGNDQSLNVIKKAASFISNNIYMVDSDARRTLHLAAVFACNFTNHLYVLSKGILAEKGLDFELLRPLIKETADKVMLASPENVQTGPAIRNDEATMARHLKELNEHPELQQLYSILSNSIKNANG